MPWTRASPAFAARAKFGMEPIRAWCFSASARKGRQVQTRHALGVCGKIVKVR